MSQGIGDPGLVPILMGVVACHVTLRAIQIIFMFLAIMGALLGVLELKCSVLVMA